MGGDRLCGCKECTRLGPGTDEAEHVFHKWLNMKKLGASPNEEHEVMVDYEEVNSTRVLEFANYKMN